MTESQTSRQTGGNGPAEAPSGRRRLGITGMLYLVLVSVGVVPLLVVGKLMVGTAVTAMHRAVEELELAVVSDVTHAVRREVALARLELNGDIFDYCRTAARHLAPGGAFCFCHQARDPRPEQAIQEAGLSLLSRQDVVFRAGHPPRLALFTCATAGERNDRPPLVIREHDGTWSKAYRRIRVAMLIDRP